VSPSGECNNITISAAIWNLRNWIVVVSNVHYFFNMSLTVYEKFATVDVNAHK